MRAPVYDPQAFVEQFLLLGLFDGPPDRFDVSVVVGDVWMVPVHPYAEILEDPCLSLYVHVRIFLAFSNEPVNAVYILNIFL